jgi:Nucleotide modification associated domain 2
MRVYSYVIDHDLGFAPNPFHGICTLAACKPKIRQYAEVGDYIVGTGSRPNGGLGRLIYWMRIDEIIDFDRYWSDPRFAANAR